MGEYADVKRKKIIKLLNWLNTQNGFTIENGGNHQWVIKYFSWKRPFPIPFKHNRLSSVYVKVLMKKLVETKVCSKEKFDSFL